MNQNQPLPPPRRGPGLFWPIILIGLGVILLLSNLGVLPANLWPLLGQLWPVILIVIGLDILLGRRSVWSGIFSAALALLVIGGIVAVLSAGCCAFVAQNYPALYRLGASDLHYQRIAHPLGDARQAEVQIDFPGGPGSLAALGDSSNLIEGDINLYGDLIDDFSSSGNSARVRLGSRSWGWRIFWGESGLRQWTIGLNPRAEYDLQLDTGSGSYTLDLRRLTLRSLKLDSGSGHVTLTLPETGRYSFRVSAGSGAVDIRAPEGMAVRVEYDAGSGALYAPGLRQVSGSRRRGTYESAGFSQTGEYVIIELDGGSGSVTIR